MDKHRRLSELELEDEEEEARISTHAGEAKRLDDEEEDGDEEEEEGGLGPKAAARARDAKDLKDGDGKRGDGHRPGLSIDVRPKPLPSVPKEYMGKLDEISDTMSGFARTWSSRLGKMSQEFRDSKEAKQISEMTERMVAVCKTASSSSPRVTAKNVDDIRREFEVFQNLMRARMDSLKAKAQSDEATSAALDDIKLKFKSLSERIRTTSEALFNDPTFGEMLEQARKSVESMVGKDRVSQIGRHVRKLSQKMFDGMANASQKGNIALKTVLAASKLQAFEHKIKTRYQKVKRDVKDTLLAHMEASVRDLAIIQQGNEVDLRSYDIVPFVVTPVMLTIMYYSTLLNLIAALVYTLIILCLLTFDFEDTCDDGIQFWFGFKMCLETAAAIFLFWILMTLRSWMKRYEAAYEMAEARGDHLMDDDHDGVDKGRQVVQFKMDHMIAQGKDSVETFRLVTNSLPWYVIKLLVLITVFYDIGAIYMANARHCAECGTSVIEYGVYIWSFWIVVTLMYRCAIILWNIFFLCLKCACCRRSILRYADIWDDHIGVGIVHYMCKKILFLDIAPQKKDTAASRKLKKLVREQTQALHKYNALDRKIRKLKQDIRREERQSLFQNPNDQRRKKDKSGVPYRRGKPRLNRVQSPLATGLAGDIGVSKKEMDKFNSVLLHANDTIFEDTMEQLHEIDFDEKQESEDSKHTGGDSNKKTI